MGNNNRTACTVCTYVNVLRYCKSLHVDDSHWKKFSEDILYKIRSFQQHSNNVISDDQLKNQILADIGHVLTSHSTPRSLKEFNLPVPYADSLLLFGNRLLLDESFYDWDSLATKHAKILSLLNEKQQDIYEAVKEANNTGSQIFAFVHGHRGTGKSFMRKMVTSYIRSKGEIVLTVAASGIASLLLPSGRTTHSRFRIPLELTNQDLCKISKQTQLAKILQRTCPIIWDEAPINDRKCIECLDRTPRDISEESNRLFGGMSILLRGDFRQTFSVKPKSTRSEIVDATLPCSYLWPHFKLFTMTQNMHLLQNPESSQHASDIANFSIWLLRVVDGKEGVHDAADHLNTKLIDIPSEFFLRPPKNNLESLINFVYGEYVLQTPNAQALSSRAIICPENETADEINQHVLD